MLFNSLHYLAFFPLVVLGYFLIPYRFRWVFLLLASYYFYMCWKAEYIILIVASTLVDYIAGIKMGAAVHSAQRKKWLIVSLASNLGLLFAFKYFNFFSDSARAVFDQFNIMVDVPHLNVLLPVGISFYTFQTLSYSIEVYRGHQVPERHLGKFALYVAYFPQLVAGPIERSVNLLPQFHQDHNFDFKRLKSGLLLMLWGFFKKLVIADRAAVVVNQVYNNAHDYQGLPLILATYLFAFQIYCDFSGYSDIAIGSARVMGIRLMKNFDLPYFSQSIAEFWRRWHISLSTWFRDYLYIPLGGNRVGKWHWHFNLFIVFLISGLWHGAAWTFVIWGGLHGLYLVFSLWTRPWREKMATAIGLQNHPLILKWVRIGITFHLVLLGWIFFRANSLADAWYILTNFLNISWSARGFGTGLTVSQLAILMVSIGILEGVEASRRRMFVGEWLSRQPFWLRWPCYYVVILYVLILGYYDSSLDFIYFQF
ncbi:MAG: MBOAT family protein [Candidatus Omnitrophica bacterium]|nr:MBOAT family protein [Candidatus Omnitrophota bacterium]